MTATTAKRGTLTLTEDDQHRIAAALLYRAEYTTEDDAAKLRELYQRIVNAESIVITED